jgi:hypothetical protein
MWTEIVSRVVEGFLCKNEVLGPSPFIPHPSKNNFRINFVCEDMYRKKEVLGNGKNKFSYNHFGKELEGSSKN